MGSCSGVSFKSVTLPVLLLNVVAVREVEESHRGQMIEWAAKPRCRGRDPADTNLFTLF